MFRFEEFPAVGNGRDLSVGNGRDVIVGSDLTVGTGSEGIAEHESHSTVDVKLKIDKVQKQLRYLSYDLMSKIPVQGDLMLHDHKSVAIDKQQA